MSDEFTVDQIVKLREIEQERVMSGRTGLRGMIKQLIEEHELYDGRARYEPAEPERVVVLRVETMEAIVSEELDSGNRRMPASVKRFAEFLETAFIKAALKRASGNKAEAARILGIDRKWLNHQIRRYGLVSNRADDPTT